MSETGTAPSPPPLFQSRLVSLLGGGLLALALLAYGVLLLTVDPDKYRGRILLALEEISGHKAQVEKLEFSLAGGLQLKLRQVELAPHDPSEPPFALVEEILVTPSLSMLWDGKRLALSSLTLVAPQFTLVQRVEQQLLERAQASALHGDRKLTRLMGVGLGELSIGRVVIKDGLVTLLDWGEISTGATLIIDQLQVSIHNLSSQRASPLTASGRFQGIPLNAHGQIGPLPGNVDLARMPLLVSMEAKAVDPSLLMELLPALPGKAKTSRSYFSALLHGTLEDGMQTGSWLELERLTLAPVHETRPTSTLGRLAGGSAQAKTVDLALRQKSVLQLQEGGLQWRLQEAYVYVGGQPVVQGEGVWHASEGMSFQARLLNPLERSWLPFLPAGFPWSGGVVSGMVRVEGYGRLPLALTLDLDLGGSSWELAPVLRKPVGAPLRLAATLDVNPDHSLTVREAALHAPPGGLVRVQGALTPHPGLRLTGSWPLGELGGYLAPAANWTGASGQLTLVQGRLWGGAGGQPWQGEGIVQLDQASLGRLKVERARLQARLASDGLELTGVQARLAGGEVEGAALLAWEEGAAAQAVVTVQGVGLRIEELGLFAPGSPLAPEGLLAGHGAWQGELGPDWLPSGAKAAWQAHLQAGPGRLANLDPNHLASEPTGETLLTVTDQAFYWETLSAELVAQQGGVWIDQLRAVGPELQLTGQGYRDPLGGRYQLTVGSEGQQWPVELEEKGDQLLLRPAARGP